MSVEPVRHRFSVEDYYGMDAAGLFEPGARRTTRRFDRTVKRRAYAAAGILELWIVDLTAGAIEVATSPGPTGYASIRRLSPADTIGPMALPDVTFEVDAILG